MRLCGKDVVESFFSLSGHPKAHIWRMACGASQTAQRLAMSLCWSFPACPITADGREAVIASKAQK